MDNKMIEDIRKSIQDGKACLGIEFGSTRIKAVLIDENNEPLASGSHSWENRYEQGMWTYSKEDIWNGLQGCYSSLATNVREKYGVDIIELAAIGFSGMMHGYMVFDENDELMVPFRTWRNTITGEAAELLTREFNFNIPQRWSVAHLYQAILNGEEHVNNISFMTTLAGYIHWKLTGKKVIGIGEASGMFPVDKHSFDYDKGKLTQFNSMLENKHIDWKLEDILPKILLAGENAGMLTLEGARLLDPSGKLGAHMPLCPPEGDAGTGMTATNSVAPRTGNVSAGTSIFSMVVLEKELEGVHKEIDIVTTPSGDPVAMVHCNNCTSDINAWVKLFKEFASALNLDMSAIDTDTLYGTLYGQALKADPDCGGLLSFNYFSGEPVTGFDEGRPLFVRTPDAHFTLANFMRMNMFSALATIKVGNDILLREEGVKLDKIYGHGGLFTTPVIGQKMMAAALNTPVATVKTAGEGGAWGIALLASYMVHKEYTQSLSDYLTKKVFAGQVENEQQSDIEDVKGFDDFLKTYKNCYGIEKAAVESLK